MTDQNMHLTEYWIESKEISLFSSIRIVSLKMNFFTLGPIGGELYGPGI